MPPRDFGRQWNKAGPNDPANKLSRNPADRPATEPRPTKKDYIEEAYQRIQDARYMGMGETAIRVELSTIWEVAEAAQGAAPRAEGLRELIIETLHRYECDDEPPGHDWREHLPEDEPEFHPNRIDALVDLFGAAPPAEGLDVERLREAIHNVENMNPLDYLDDGDTADAYAAEYDRLSRPSDERVPESEER